MALTRKVLKGMGISDEQIDVIIEAHTETIEGLKEEARKNAEAAAKLPDVQKELDDLKAAGDGGYKEKWEKEHQAFEDYKASVTAQATAEKKRAAIDAALKAAGVARDSFRSTILKGWDLKGVEIDEAGKLKDEAAVKAVIDKDYAEFISTTTTTGTPPTTPPAGNGRMTKAEILKITDKAEQRQAIAQNLDLFKST